MKVVAKDSFFESLKALARHQTWWYKTYELFRYDIPRFVKNVWKFRKELWNFYPWDSAYNARLFKKSLELTVANIEQYGFEEATSKGKKIVKMKRAIEILENFTEDRYTEIAEKQIGREVNVGNVSFKKLEDSEGYEMVNESEEVAEANREIYELSRKIEAEEWKELWEIIQGQDYSKFQPTDPEDWDKTEKEYREWFDGSGMKSWWD